MASYCSRAVALAAVILAAGIHVTNAQNANDFLNTLGGIIQQAVRQAAQTEWQKLPPSEMVCLDQRLHQQGGSVNDAINRGVSPTDPRLSQLRASCRAASTAVSPANTNASDIETLSSKPTFDCAKARRLTALMVCLDEAGARADWDLSSAYWARFFSLPQSDQQAFDQAQQRWLDALNITCQSRPQSQQGQCILSAYQNRAAGYRSQLNDEDVLAESRLTPEQHAKIQQSLVTLALLNDAPDGEFGPNTRAAIKRFQANSGAVETGFLTAQQREQLLQAKTNEGLTGTGHFGDNPMTMFSTLPVCQVADPTGTPLNVRTTPNGGEITDTMSNGTQVRLLRTEQDSRGKNWSQIELVGNGRTLGWVYRDYVDCTGNAAKMASQQLQPLPPPAMPTAVPAPLSSSPSIPPAASVQNTGASACDLYAASEYDTQRKSVGVPFDKIDFRLAVPACEAAVRQFPDDSRLNYQLGRAYQKAGNFAAAINQYRKAAEQGSALAQNNIGVMYQNGLGVPKDFGQAVALYRKAAEKGLAPAQSALGFMYENGLGVPKDLNEAVTWYRKAADQGFALAQNKLQQLSAAREGTQQGSVAASPPQSTTAASGSQQSRLPPGAVGIFAIRTPSGYVTAVGGGGIQGPNSLRTNAKVVGDWETFTLINLGADQYAIQTFNGNYLTAVFGGGVGNDAIHTDATKIGGFERFTLFDQGGGSYAIRTMKGTFLTAVNGGGIGGSGAFQTLATIIREWEKFAFEHVGPPTAESRAVTPLQVPATTPVSQTLQTELSESPEQRFARVLFDFWMSNWCLRTNLQLKTTEGCAEVIHNPHNLGVFAGEYKLDVLSPKDCELTIQERYQRPRDADLRKTWDGQIQGQYVVGQSIAFSLSGIAPDLFRPGIIVVFKFPYQQGPVRKVLTAASSNGNWTEKWVQLPIQPSMVDVGGLTQAAKDEAYGKAYSEWLQKIGEEVGVDAQRLNLEHAAMPGSFVIPVDFIFDKQTGSTLVGIPLNQSTDLVDLLKRLIAKCKR